MKKKALALLMTSTITLSAAAMPIFASDFSDMPNNWSTEALENAVANGLLQGYEEGNETKIKPQKNLKRAEMATVINKAFNSQNQANISGYTDVKQGDWFYPEMAKAVAMKTFVGSNNKLNPQTSITREEAFSVLARAFNIPKTTSDSLTNFVDQGDISSWARDEVAALVSEGYVSGSDGRINPKKNISRAEFAVIMDNLVKTYISSGTQYTSDYTGNVIINKANVSLKGSTITGDLIIGDGVDEGSVTLEDVKVTGRVVVRSGYVNILGNSDIDSIIASGITKKISVDGNSVVNSITADNDGLIIEGSGTVTEVTANANNISVNVEGAKVTAAEGTSGVTLNGKSVAAGTTSEDEVKDTFVNYSDYDRTGKVTLPEGANVSDYAVLVTGLQGSTAVIDKVVSINSNKETIFTFTNNSAYTLKLVKRSAPTIILDETTFITNHTAQNITTLKVVDSNIVTDLVNTSLSEAIEVEYESTVADLLSAIETIDSGATIKVFSATGANKYEVAGTVKAKSPMIVEVTAKNGTTKVEYPITAKSGAVNTLKVIDANVASKSGTVITVDQGTTVSQLLAAVKADDNKATVEVLSKASGGSELAETDVLTDGTTPSSSDANIIRVTPQDGTAALDYTITITPVTQSSDTTIKSLDLNKVTTSGTVITIVDTVNVKTATDLLAAIETVDANATVKVLGTTGGSEVVGSHIIATGTTVVEVTAQNGTTTQEYTIN